jgi:hypothetical protein
MAAQVIGQRLGVVQSPYAVPYFGPSHASAAVARASVPVCRQGWSGGRNFGEWLEVRSCRRPAFSAGHVHVVAAGVGDRDLMAPGVLRGRRAGVVRAGVLLDRQSVQFGPEQNGGPGAIGQDAHDARAADARLDRAAILLQLPGDALGCAVLLVRQLRMAMQILVERFLAGPEAVIAGQDLLEAAP